MKSEEELRRVGLRILDLVQEEDLTPPECFILFKGLYEATVDATLEGIMDIVMKRSAPQST